MYKHAKLFANVAASAPFSLFLGCGGSPHTYTLSTLTPSAVVAGTGDFTVTLDGVYLTEGAYVTDAPELTLIQTVIDTTFPGPSIDPKAPAGSTVATVGMERDGLRSGLLVVTSSMLDPITTESNAGVYITQVMPQSRRGEKSPCATSPLALKTLVL